MAGGSGTGTDHSSARAEEAGEDPSGDDSAGTERFLSGRLEGQSRLEYAGRRAWALVGIGIVGWALLRILSKLGVVLIPALITAVIVILCSPIVRRLAARGIPRLAGTLICYAILGALLAGFMVLVIPAMAGQIRLLAEEAPAYFETGLTNLEGLQDRLDESSPHAGDALREARQSIEGRVASMSGTAVEAVIGTVQATIELLAALLIAAIVSFMVLIDSPRITSATSEWMDRPRNRRVAGALRAMHRSVVWYVRGQIITGIVTGILVTFSLWVLDIPFYLPLGAIAGLLHFIPGLGPLIAGVPAVLIALISGGIGKAIIVTIVTVVILQAVAYLVAPRILGKVVELSPITVIVALVIGGALFGIAGVLLAVPVVAALRDGLRWAMYTPEEVEAAYAEGIP
ncbi:MAG: hypothetical protein DCC49_08435 [Acidobacteria bacterium]|nr:MAG: hypothetical protein DCC49_08435 [Acidobacteriota bacterium]